MMKKTISLMIVAILLLGVFTGCQPSEELSPAEKKDLEIRQAFLDWTGTKEYTADDLTLRIVWQRDDIYALYVDGPFFYEDALTGFAIEGIRFRFPDGQHPYIYSNGFFYSFQKGYEEGVLTKEDLESLHKDGTYQNIRFPEQSKIEDD